MQTKAK